MCQQTQGRGRPLEAEEAGTSGWGPLTASGLAHRPSSQTPTPEAAPGDTVSWALDRPVDAQTPDEVFIKPGLLRCKSRKAIFTV